MKTLSLRSVASDWLTVSSTHAMSANCQALNSLSHRTAAIAIATDTCASDWLTIASTHAVLAEHQALNSLIRRAAAIATATKSCASDWSTVAVARVVLARCQALNSLSRRFADWASRVPEARDSTQSRLGGSAQDGTQRSKVLGGPGQGRDHTQHAGFETRPHAGIHPGWPGHAGHRSARHYTGSCSVAGQLASSQAPGSPSPRAALACRAQKCATPRRPTLGDRPAGNQVESTRYLLYT